MYIVKNPNRRFYVGLTDDLERRVTEHNSPEHSLSKYTTKHTGPRSLVWQEEHADRASAMARERSIKAMKSSRWIRENLIAR